MSRKIDVSSLADYGKWLQSAGPQGARFGTTSLQSFTHFFGLMVGRALGQPLEAVYLKGASPMDRERELRATLDSRGTTELLTQLGLDVETSTGEQCGKRLAADMVHWQSILDTLGLKATN